MIGALVVGMRRKARVVHPLDRVVLVEEGDDVSRGEVLVRLDGDRLRYEKEQAQANLRKLQRDYQRNLDLKNKGLISEGDFDRIQYEMEALEAANNLANLELDYTQELDEALTACDDLRFIPISEAEDITSCC